VILTARDSVSATVAGLEGGADDYVTKPFRFDERLTRAGSAARRAHRGGDRPRRGQHVARPPHAPALVNGDTVELSAREFALAELFFRHPGQVLSREQILTHVWGYDFDPSSNVVDVYVGYLRRKLGRDRITAVRREMPEPLVEDEIPAEAPREGGVLGRRPRPMRR
jgi:two-component system, OmpR family, copper resistance phosphate regulon response regulator CusR